MHWIQDCFRANDNPNHVSFNEEVLYQALSLAQVRKSDIELVATNSKAADPGKFKDERKWPEWEKAFTNYLSVIPGVSGIPLSYVIREVEVPLPTEAYTTFNERIVSRAPLLLVLMLWLYGLSAVNGKYQVNDSFKESLSSVRDGLQQCLLNASMTSLLSGIGFTLKLVTFIYRQCEFLFNCSLPAFT